MIEQIIILSCKPGGSHVFSNQTIKVIETGPEDMPFDQWCTRKRLSREPGNAGHRNLLNNKKRE
jgi:hypothetical protein